MKKRLLSLVAILLFAGYTHAYAEDTDTEKPEPNIYEKKKINIQNNFRDNLINKEELPEVQKELTFEKPEQTKNNLVKDQLFQSIDEEINTVASKSEQLGLFSEENSRAIALNMDDERLQQDTSKLIYILLSAVVAIILSIFLLIIPRLNQGNAS